MGTNKHRCAKLYTRVDSAIHAPPLLDQLQLLPLNPLRHTSACLVETRSGHNQSTANAFRIATSSLVVPYGAASGHSNSSSCSVAGRSQDIPLCGGHPRLIQLMDPVQKS